MEKGQKIMIKVRVHDNPEQATIKEVNKTKLVVECFPYGKDKPMSYLVDVVKTKESFAWVVDDKPKNKYSNINIELEEFFDSEINKELESVDFDSNNNKVYSNVNDASNNLELNLELNITPNYAGGKRSFYSFVKGGKILGGGTSFQAELKKLKTKGLINRKESAQFRKLYNEK